MSDQIRDKRIGIVGVIIIAIFLTLVSRLWYLQIANGQQFAAAATSNSVRVVQEEAPRGRILDINGKVIVDNRITRSVVVDRQQLKKKETKEQVLKKLSELLGVDRKDIEKRIADQRISPYQPVPVAIDVELEKIQYIKERQDEFPGVDGKNLPVRRYPNGNTAAHLVGYVGEINDAELEAHKDDNYQLGETIGKSGIELAYEKYLRGTPSNQTVEIDAKGNVLRELSYKPAVPGDDVYLTIDINTQRVAEEALAQQIGVTKTQRDIGDKTKFATFKAPAGSVVMVDPNNGYVRALASFPTYNPSDFVEGISTPLWQELNDPNNHYPLNNRVTQGLYAPGSTFKMVTALAGERAGIITPNSGFNDTGSLKVSDRVFNNAGKKANGYVTLNRALTVSSDTYFYNIGYKLWSLQKKGKDGGNQIQDTAREFGFGEKTGLPIGNEGMGRIPDQKWKETAHKNNPTAFPYKEWLPGDNVNTAIGQGDTLVTPMQLAMAYGAFANNGKLYTPQLVSKIVPAGETKAVYKAKPDLRRTLKLDSSTVSAMKSGFRGVISSQEGTAYSAFSSFPAELQAAGKTGTAQVSGKQDTSLFVGFLPYDKPKFVGVSVVEQAGFGAGTAAPIVRKTFEGAYGLAVSEVGFTSPPGGAD